MEGRKIARAKKKEGNKKKEAEKEKKKKKRKITYLEADSITRDCRKPSVPQPLQHLHGTLDACVFGTRGGRICLLRVEVHLAFPLAGDADAHQKYVSSLEGDVTLLGDL